MVILPSPKSVTHLHLLSIINTQIQGYAAGSAVRVLDAGCGLGELLAYLHNCLAILRPDLRFEIYGFDIPWGSPPMTEAKERTALKLQTQAPGPDWGRRISLLAPSASWPYPDAHFHAIVSNQVLEHVADHSAFFSEIKRTLVPGGFSAHLFPLKNCFLEGHTWVPFAHRIKNHDTAVAYLRLMHRLGFGRLDAGGRPSRRGHANAENQADWVIRFVNYRSKDDFLSVARRVGLRASFRFTEEFYWAKLRTLLKRTPKYTYWRRSVLRDWFFFESLKYVSGITLYLERPATAEDDELLLPQQDLVDVSRKVSVA